MCETRGRGRHGTDGRDGTNGTDKTDTTDTTDETDGMDVSRTIRAWSWRLTLWGVCLTLWSACLAVAAPAAEPTAPTPVVPAATAATAAASTAPAASAPIAAPGAPATAPAASAIAPAARALLPLDPVTLRQRRLRQETAARLVQSGLDCLRRLQNPDGSWGTLQVHLQTSLGILAFLSAGETPDGAAHPVTRAARWLVEHSGDDGALGDGEHPMESHAVAGLALAELIGMLPDAALDSAVERRADQALAYSLRVQDRAVGAEYYGGWKADLKDKMNDRPVTVLQLSFLRAMHLRGRALPRSALANAQQFVEGSQKLPGSGRDYDRADLGGFSYDAAGLPVILVTSAGLAGLSAFERPEPRRDAARRWLEDNRPIWFGPRFFLTHFFASRAYARETARGYDAEADRYAARVLELLRDHQNADGSFQLPAGNAENTLKMGATYATPLAVLILNAERGLLPGDTW